MAFINLQRDDFERSAVTLRPKVHYVSSSAGITGSQFVSPVRSKCIKKTRTEVASDADRFTITYHESNQPENFTKVVAEQLKSDPSLTDISEKMEVYLSEIVPSAVLDERFTKTIDVHRLDPSFKFDPPGGQSLMVKNNVRNVMMPHYKYKYQDSGFYYRNFNTINFYTASNLPNEAVLMYPDSSNKYIPTKGFSTSFWINPRYKSEPEQNFNAGTIVHISSSLCVSLISGSSKDSQERVDSYKILLQLSQSADIAPSEINFNSLSYPSDLVFTSSNELKFNNWHNVTFSWGSDSYNDFTGSLYVDDVVTNFVIPSSSIGTLTKNIDGNSALFVGNYYEGNANQISKFFNSVSSTNEGLEQLDSGNSDPDNALFSFTHPLNAEFHDLRIYDTHLSSSQVLDKREKSETVKNDLLFYLPPFYFPSSSQRDIIQTPFQKFNSSSNDPFNVSFSFGVGGKEINVENFLLDYKNNSQPRLFHMTASTLDKTVTDITADEYVYASGSILKRNFLLLPNDNGLFFPQYKLLQDLAVEKNLTSSFLFRDEGLDYSRISLEDLVPTSSLFPGLIFDSGSEGSILSEIIGASPENPGVVPGSVLTMAQRTRDMSSNEIVIFNVSNIFYGDRIVPGTLEINDSNLTGSDGKITIKLKDNKRGGLYRADCLTEQAQWAPVGNVFYDEGVSIVKSPHLLYFCKDVTDIKLRGEHNIHTMIINVPVNRSILNKSVNKTFKALPPSKNLNDKDLTSIQLSSINIHDENFNVIMRANFAQPITKTEEDEFVVRLKEDF